MLRERGEAGGLVDEPPNEKAGNSGVRRLSPSPILSNPPLTSIADTGRRPEALEYEEGADAGAFAGNTNEGRGNGPVAERGEGISEKVGEG